jgi:hypothetical protein
MRSHVNSVRPRLWLSLFFFSKAFYDVVAIGNDAEEIKSGMVEK